MYNMLFIEKGLKCFSNIVAGYHKYNLLNVKRKSTQLDFFGKHILSNKKNSCHFETFT